MNTRTFFHFGLLKKELNMYKFTAWLPKIGMRHLALKKKIFQLWEQIPPDLRKPLWEIIVFFLTILLETFYYSSTP